MWTPNDILSTHYTCAMMQANGRTPYNADEVC